MTATLQLVATEVRISAGDAALEGTLTRPAACGGVVVFAHGSGSSRFSPRNRRVADTLHRAGLATLLFDLLTPRESEIDAVTAELRFDIELLSRRLGSAVDWLVQHPSARRLAVGLFGASTGAAAALCAAAARPQAVAAVVSRGGRPDLADPVLPRVKAPTLLIVGGEDRPVIDMNLAAASRLTCEHRLEIVAGATHLFEEPGKLEIVAQMAGRWFVRHLRRSS